MAARPVAVFDIDGTLYRSMLHIDLVEELIRREIFPQAAGNAFRGADEGWLNRRAGQATGTQKVFESFCKYAKGIPYGDIADVAGEIIEKRKDYVYSYTSGLLKELKKEGYYLLAVSHSPKFIVDGFAYEWGFDKSYGVFYETGASNRFTGDIVDEHLIANKATILKRAVEKEKLDIERSTGVGDTESDISMLDLVETPIAFNPNRILYRHAKKKDWAIVVERKDVIYEI